MIAPDVEELVVNYLSQTFANVGVQMPVTPPLPFYLVTRIATVEKDTDWVTDAAVVSIHAFAATRTAASTAARALHNVMNPWVLTPKLSFSLSTGTAFVDRVCVMETPTWRDYENPNLQRYCGRYRIDLRLNQTS